MKFFLDTADIAEIEEAASWGVLAGVTTNPSLYARIGGKIADFENHVKRICDIVEGPVSAETAAHEVGHAHGLLHAPCGGAGGPDPNYPTDPAHAQARIGVWGYDQITSVLFDPLVDKGAVKDMMSYCSPTWISDFHYAKLIDRVRGDNKFYADVFRGDTPRWGGQHQAYGVEPDGKILRKDLASRERFIEGGEPREVVWKTLDGPTMGQGTARFFPYDHLPGGVLWVPDAPDGAVTAEVGGIVTPQRVRFSLR